MQQSIYFKGSTQVDDFIEKQASVIIEALRQFLKEGPLHDSHKES